MKKQLTADQLQAVINFVNYPEIDHLMVSADSKSGRINISLSSTLDTRIELVENRLLTVFTKVEHTGKPFVPESKGDGILTVLHELKVGIENVSVCLHMYSSLEIRKAPAPTGATLEINQSNYTTESEVIANA